MANLKQMVHRPELLTGGHRLCAGCGHASVVRQVLLGTEDPVVVVNATGCLEVSTTIFPYTAWRSPWMHSAFENAGAVASGIEAAYVSLKRQGKIKENVQVVAFGGDGGTYDIGFQSLSGAMERGHKLVYVCLDNEGYMNTGIQRSSATPIGADTTTTPAGKVSAGKKGSRKDLTAIIAAHNVAYAAQASPSHWNDLITKAQKAFKADGAAFINVLSCCPRGWRMDTADTIDITRLAVDTCFWPLYEVDHGEWKLNYNPKEKKPVIQWLERQGRFRHLFTEKNRHVIDEIQDDIDRRWEELQARCELMTHRPAAPDQIKR